MVPVRVVREGRLGNLAYVDQRAAISDFVQAITTTRAYAAGRRESDKVHCFLCVAKRVVFMVAYSALSYVPVPRSRSPRFPSGHFDVL